METVDTRASLLRIAGDPTGPKAAIVEDPDGEAFGKIGVSDDGFGGEIWALGGDLVKLVEADGGGIDGMEFSAPESFPQFEGALRVALQEELLDQVAIGGGRLLDPLDARLIVVEGFHALVGGGDGPLQSGGGLSRISSLSFGFAQGGVMENGEIFCVVLLDSGSLQAQAINRLLRFTLTEFDACHTHIDLK